MLDSLSKIVSTTTFATSTLPKYAGSIPLDVFVLLGIFSIFFLYGLYFGKSRLVSILLAFYPAVYFYEKFPFVSKFLVLQGDKLLVLNKVIIFLLPFILFDIIISSYTFSDTVSGKSNYISVTVFAIAATILVLVFSYSVISLDVFYNFSSHVDKVISGVEYHNLFWWSMVPFLALFVL
jgi:hypothetical protein